MDDLLRAGIAAAKSGQRERAYDLLMQVVDKNEDDILAWLWLSSVVDSLDEREVCLENVLALDPTHKAARQGLAWVREQRGARTTVADEATYPPSPAQESPPAGSTRIKTPVSPAAAVLREDFARRQPALESSEPEPPSLPVRDEFEDEYLCPYCAAQTAPEDRKCPACGNALWIKIRRREERSSWLWVALTLQAASIIWPAFTALFVLFFAARQAELDNFFRLVPLYLGLPGDIPSETADAAFNAVPRLYVLPLAPYILLSLAVMVGLYLRWKPVFYLYLANTLIMLGSAVAGISVGLDAPGGDMILSQRIGLICGGAGMILALFMFFLAIQIADDFFYDEKRLLLRVDRDATNGPALLSSGQNYARQHMWALAAVHLRRAIARMPQQLDPYLALTVAYLNLKSYDSAASTLEEARRIEPSDPQVEHLAQVLTSQRAAEKAPAATIPE